jgi:serine/threonine protein kinase
MKPLSNAVVDRLRQVVDTPDLSATRYELDREIGRGGLGTVYAARDRELGRLVAIKVLDAPGASNRGLEEARLIASLEHPAIVPIYEAGALPDGRAWYAMKLVDGMRLDAYANGPSSLSERLRVLRRIGEAISFAHSRGVIHRDLKPQNVMIGSFGEVYVMDWGVNGVAGTPQFRAPEQGSGAADERSDVFGLGALLRFLLPSKPPKPLQAIAARAMSIAPEQRYSSAAEMMCDLQRFEDGLPVSAYRESPLQAARRFVSRNRVLLALLAAYVAARFFLFFLRSLG